jgi:hypothetical protein
MREYVEARFKTILAAFDSAAHSDALKAKSNDKN